ncbi:peptidoglycan-binding protein [Sphingobium sp. BS19]|uniref:peptidoglycan-binding protein n=1 Tax=Sphingobium sp. BS19 TaxID=3018973 RepID=UPI0022EFD320|nr:peptidoglycan-binding protein [Sphingobium sp. BS19]GLI96282.1 hypothetical protein Sbs19_01000 [Sphingobium sp. BS19]
MISLPELNTLAPAQKAAIIYAEAHGEVATRLWRAALGSEASTDTRDTATQISDTPGFNLQALLSLLSSHSDVSAPQPSAILPQNTIPKPIDLPPAVPVDIVGFGEVKGLGPNIRFGDALVAAARRTGIPAAALAAIVDAEAAKGGDGSWKTASRNPRSSAAGLGQFLAGTWQGEAERPGTWLHGIATSHGWIGGDGRILPAARSSLLALRYDAATSIHATADYAQRSVAQLKKAGIPLDENVGTVARAAYLGHHLGAADAIRFLKGGLGSGRAKLLLDAQVGSAAANQRIAQAGDAASAHRSWLLDYVNRHVTPARFAA